MKKIYNLIALLLLTATLTHATPQVTGFSVLSNWLQNGKIKVYDGGPTEFMANISASRAMNGSAYESVEMQAVFYIVSSGTEHELKTITLTSSHFNGGYLQYYNETAGNPPAANNLVKVSIPANINHGRVAVKYRWKDANGEWQPVINGGDEYTYLNNYGYDTINLTSPNWWEAVSPYINSVPLHRIFNSQNQKHMLAANSEAYYLIGNGSGWWKYDGIIGHVKSSQELGTVPLYRYFKGGSTSDHYYTTSSTAPSGYISEGIQGYVYTSQVANTQPVYVYHKTTGGLDHLYTSNYGELGAGNSTWSLDGIGFYILE